MALALRALMPRLPEGTPVVVGLGLHRPMTAAELAPLAPWSPAQHDPDDVVPTATVDGVPGEIWRGAAEVDQILSVGVAELHQYAGLSGGHKGVAVGLGGRATISTLHARDRVLAPGVRLGQLDGNPFRAAVDALGEAARCLAALVWIPSARRWAFGPPTAVLRAASALIQPWVPCDRTYAGAVLHVPAAKASSLYQASRAATYLALSPRPPLEEGATLVLHAACPEGLGAEAGWVAALTGSPPPWEALLTGPEPRGPGAQRAVMLALLARRYRLEIAGCVDPRPFTQVGLRATTAPPPEGPAWLQVTHPFDHIPQRAG